MSRRRTAVLVAVALLVAIPAVAVTLRGPRPSDAGPVLASVQTAPALAPGEAVTLDDGRRIHFVEVVHDSRCPADVMCLWMGEARVLLEVQPPGAAPERVEAVIGVSGAAEVAGGVLDGVTLDLLPYPLAAVPIAAADYRLVLSIR